MGVGDLAQFGSQVRTIAALTMICGAVALVLAVRGGRDGLRLANAVLAVGSAAAIVVATVTPRTTPTRGGPPNLEPLRTVRGYFWLARHGGGMGDLVVYFAGNVALFLPLGLFGYFALRRGVLVTVAAGALLSLAVETAQLGIWTRSFDVDDLWTNTLGALLGAGIAWLGDTSRRRYGGRHVSHRASGPSAFLRGE